MRFFLDENEQPVILEPLRLVYGEHEFISWQDENLRGLDDIPLIREVGVRGFDALITRDKNQLADPEERHALIASGLHWIGHREPHAGRAGVTSLIAGYISAFPHIIDHIVEAAECTAYHVRQVPREQGQRLKIRPVKVDD